MNLAIAWHIVHYIVIYIICVIYPTCITCISYIIKRFNSKHTFTYTFIHTYSLFYTHTHTFTQTHTHAPCVVPYLRAFKVNGRIFNILLIAALNCSSCLAKHREGRYLFLRGIPQHTKKNAIREFKVERILHTCLKSLNAYWV